MVGSSGRCKKSLQLQEKIVEKDARNASGDEREAEEAKKRFEKARAEDADGVNAGVAEICRRIVYAI